MDTLDNVKDLVNTNQMIEVVPKSPKLGSRVVASGDDQGVQLTPMVMVGADGQSKKVMLKGLRKERTCSYLPGGTCTVHGGGATRKLKPVVMRKKKPDGSYSVRMKKEPYYVCENNTRATQTRLSFGTRSIENTLDISCPGNSGSKVKGVIPDTLVGKNMM